MVLKEQVALVTGASRGIGARIAHVFAAQGALVVGTATSEDGVERINASLAQFDPVGYGRVLDVTDESSIEALFEHLGQADALPDILVNNAGITKDNLLARMKEDEWDAVISANLTSVFRLSKLCARNLMRKRRGRIINVSSVVASMGNAGQTNYAAAKAGMEGFTRALARELGSRNITVNSIAPGFVDTDMTRGLPDDQRNALLARIPLGRLGSPEDIAHAALFLASPAAAYITGETLHVNGGMYMS